MTRSAEYLEVACPDWQAGPRLRRGSEAVQKVIMPLSACSIS